MKIALLTNKKRTGQVFKDEHLDFLSGIGELAKAEPATGPDEETAAKIIEGADIAITSWDCHALTKPVLDMAPGLKMVFHAAGSVKGIVTDELWERGIRVSSAACVLGRAVAETTLGLTIYSMKNIKNLAEHTRNGGWNELNTTVRDIYDLKIGVVGAGNAGRHYIKLLKNFQVEILLYDPTLDEQQCREMGAEKADLDTLMKLCDVVSIHAPSIPATRHMINADNLKLMKDRAVLINTARGSLIDEDALVKELEKGRISACIDVTDPEPPVADSALRKLPNVLLTPHLAGNASTGKKRIGGVAVSEISLFTTENRLEHEVFINQMNIIA